MIKYVQTGEYDCFPVCVAIATQKPVNAFLPDEVIAGIESEKGTYGDMTTWVLEQAGLENAKDFWRVDLPVEWYSHHMLRRILNGRRAILQVPSLKYPKSQHALFWDGYEIHDPSKNDLKYRWIEQCSISYVWIFNEVR